MNEVGVGDHRKDIDGLRAIAVLSILAFHAGFRWCRGGYRGVDMFFVISGFLITGIILREHRAQAFSLAGFYERRLRRIVPALFVMLAVVAVLAYVVMLPADLKLFAQNLTAIALFSSNILFWKRAGGFDFYFEPSAQLNPLLHTWSLGVEEQFYLIVPVALWLVWRFRRPWLVPMLIITAVASFTYSSLIDGQWGLGFHTAKEANFYLLPSRAWQLLLGAIVAAIGPTDPRASRRRGQSEWVAVAAVSMITWSMLVTGDVDVYFPSVCALPATVGTALLLWCGRGTVVASWLSRPPLVGVGLISYSVYLWHQPLFALAHYVSLDDHLALGTLVLLCAGSLVIGWASWRWVERPFRDRQRVSTRRVVQLSAVGTAAFLVAGLGFALRAPTITRGRLLSSGPLLASLTNVVLPAAMRECAADETVAPVRQGCALNTASAERPSFLVLGDSHAGALLPAFRRVSAETGQQGRMLALRGCPPLFDVFAEMRLECLAMQRSALELVQTAGITRVFLVARWAGYTDGDYDGRMGHYVSQHGDGYQPLDGARTAIVDGLKRTIEAYTKTGVTVYLVEQVPQQAHRPIGIYLQALLRPGSQAYLAAASVTLARHAGLQTFMRQTFAAYAANARVKRIDLAPSLCADGVCPVGTMSQSYYWDASHLSDVGALRVSEELRRQGFGGS